MGSLTKGQKSTGLNGLLKTDGSFISKLSKEVNMRMTTSAVDKKARTLTRAWETKFIQIKE